MKTLDTKVTQEVLLRGYNNEDDIENEIDSDIQKQYIEEMVERKQIKGDD